MSERGGSGALTWALMPLLFDGVQEGIADGAYLPGEDEDAGVTVGGAVVQPWPFIDALTDFLDCGDAQPYTPFVFSWRSPRGLRMALIDDQKLEQRGGRQGPEEDTALLRLPLPSPGLLPMLGGMLRECPAALADWYEDNGLPRAAARLRRAIGADTASGH